jgi:hypothetical protein
LYWVIPRKLDLFYGLEELWIFERLLWLEMYGEPPNSMDFNAFF